MHGARYVCACTSTFRPQSPPQFLHSARAERDVWRASCAAAILSPRVSAKLRHQPLSTCPQLELLEKEQITPNMLALAVAALSFSPKSPAQPSGEYCNVQGIRPQTSACGCRRRKCFQLNVLDRCRWLGAVHSRQHHLVQRRLHCAPMRPPPWPSAHAHAQHRMTPRVTWPISGRSGDQHQGCAQDGQLQDGGGVGRRKVHLVPEDGGDGRLHGRRAAAAGQRSEQVLP